MIFNIYIANHGRKDGVEDFITILENILKKRDHEVIISNSLHKGIVNIVIDEFTNYICNREIAEFKKKNPESLLIYVLTEFVETRWLVRSFNFYGGLLDAAVIAAMNIYIRRRRDDFITANYRDWLLGLLFSPLLSLYVIRHIIRNLLCQERLSLIDRVRRNAYLLMRYQGLEAMIKYADYLILSHPMIARNLKYIVNNAQILGNIYPEIDIEEIKSSIFSKKLLFIEITGSITPYRRKVISEIDLNLLELGLHAWFGSCRSISFANSDEWRAERGAYSLHPPQTRNWRYSSPTRIYRALQHDHNMPVITKTFNQHPIERLCLEYRGHKTLIEMCRYYDRPEELIDWLEPMARKYMDIAGATNDSILKDLIRRIDTD